MLAKLFSQAAIQAFKSATHRACLRGVGFLWWAGNNHDPAILLHEAGARLDKGAKLLDCFVGSQAITVDQQDLVANIHAWSFGGEGRCLSEMVRMRASWRKNDILPADMNRRTRVAGNIHQGAGEP